ncbi:chondroitinase family polysaccharide lyase [Virgibacillus halodenitrificans]|uniref:chondroitinase family polysaccharide lyase n=1 Tax=Virgibacillus halodenitrificans TaxID=1482 RepID=UPI0024BF1458|nr:chondroitinase family polysaccharide lyase [Virgibacillus halodenitrificans]WHX26206.1 chondroitinase family polysaccharide lyase [Virgibacillus halodenitrificans]
MKKLKVIFFVIFTALFYPLISSQIDIAYAANKETSNLLKNGGFEETIENKEWLNSQGPADWSQWKASGDPELVVDNQISHSGKQSIKIQASSDSRASVEQHVMVIPGKEYKLSAWVKTDKVTSNHGARLRLTFLGDKKVYEYSNEVTGTSDWKHIEKIVKVPEGYNTVRIQNFLEKGTGTVWFDNITLEEWDSSDKDKESSFSFESGVPDVFSTDSRSTIKTTEARYKDGKNSLEWTFKADSQLTINNPIDLKNMNKDTFGIWIYNETPINDELIFDFGSNGKTDASFTFNLKFTGWRTAWVPFHDMEGNPNFNMNTVSITAPKSVTEGKLYMDQMVLSNPVDPRYPTRDVQVPFVNKEADQSPNAHWLSLYKFDFLLPKSYEANITEGDRSSLQTIEDRYKEFELREAEEVTNQYMKDIKEQFASYMITRGVNTITGRPVNLKNIKDIYPKEAYDEIEKLVNGIDVRDYTDFMKEVAVAYQTTDNETYKSELKSMFLDLLEHMHDQGWAWGSSLGSMHHLGYNMRGYYPAVVLMKDELKEAGLLNRTQKMMSWYTGIGRIYEDLNKNYANIDILNTTLKGMVATILVEEDKEKQIALLERLRDWLNQGLLPAPGLMPAFKPDGSAFHHMGFYPAYARDAFEGMTPVVYMLSNTTFHISEEAHGMLKKAVLASRLYSNKYEWLIGVAGRHPTNRLHLESFSFKYMALAGTPDRKEDIDPELAAAYLRLVEPENVDETTMRLRSMGYKAEAAPNGNWTMNYGVLALHRRDNWLVGVKGHHRYHWSNEIYSNANLFGRYTTYGQIQILGKGNPVNYLDSGYTQEGWDWNRWPGTTTKHLPIDKLRAKSTTEMLLTDESYAGGLNIEGENGMFAMKLHEHPKYDESFRARKSVFMFENRIIALGSNIENTDQQHETETTLFQNHMVDKKDPVRVNGKKVTDFPYENTLNGNKSVWMLDNKDNGYYIPAGQEIGIHKETQHSRDQKDDRDTQGDFATAWLKHGKAPDNGSYEYAVLVDSNPGQINAFTRKMDKSNHAPYTVLQKDYDAHIVKDSKSKTTGYAIMEPNDSLDKGHIISVDTPSMIMIKEKGNDLILSEVDPDWHLYEGKDEDQYDDNGNFVGGEGPYSRPWKENESKVHQLRLTLKGEWRLKEKGDNYRIISNDEGKTVLEFDNKDAMPIEIQLAPVKDTYNAD